MAYCNITVHYADGTSERLNGEIRDMAYGWFIRTRNDERIFIPSTSVKKIVIT